MESVTQHHFYYLSVDLNLFLSLSEKVIIFFAFHIFHFSFRLTILIYLVTLFSNNLNFHLFQVYFYLKVKFTKYVVSSEVKLFKQVNPSLIY